MSDEMTTAPALTPEEWAHVRGELDWQEGRGPLDDAVSGAAAALCYTDVPPQRRRHAAAALCLYGQPYGFTRAEMEAVALVAENRAALSADDLNVASLVRSVAAKIAALLPPETP